MNLINLAAQMFLKNLGNQQIDEGNVIGALSKLLPTGQNGDIDLGSILGMLQGGSLASLAASWLGDGSNSPISSNQIMDVLGQGKVQDFASSLNMNQDEATNGLANMIPDLIDQNSKGGTLLDAVGGSDMLGSLAKGVLGNLFK